jgi:branched-chain amino acid transport system substrate-binding protein
MRRLFAIILVCALIAGVGVGCKKAEVKPTEQVVNLGGIYPMTGGSATFGTSSQQGTAMAVEEFNAAGGAMVDGVKTTINYINEDDAGSPEVGASAAQKLINQDKVIHRRRHEQGYLGRRAYLPVCRRPGDLANVHQ